MTRRLEPPGTVETVHAESALLLAPHYDDEVVGCGGLVARLTASGAAVRVLFLTDSGGGSEAVEDRDAYRRRRREEAAAAAEVLGLAGSDHLGLPDGELHRRLDEAAAGIRRALIAHPPELVLVPSPLEVSSDHRAAFAALHRVLAPVRPLDALENLEDEEDLGQPGDAARLLLAVMQLRVLVYEVNQPAWPDLLVDVSAELPRISAAMECYASQQERHDYLGAALGLRRFRTLTLPPTVEAAEGYRRLAAQDFLTRSPAQLVEHLGGRAELLEVREGPRISVVVRTKDRPELLAEALESLAAGSWRRAEVVLVNDGGRPPEVAQEFPLRLRRVDLPENRGRAAAANAGVAAAKGDWIAFLDDDDLAAPEHLATLAEAVSAAEVRVAYTDAAVGVYALEPGAPGWTCVERRLPYSRDFDPDLLLLDNYIPFNTLLIERSLFAEVGTDPQTPFDPELPFFEDWDFLIRLSRRARFHHLRRVTCEYRHFRGGGHHVLGETPRRRADFLAMKARVLARHASELAPETLARAVDTLRRELVEAAEEAAVRRAEAEASRERAAAAAEELETLARAHQKLSRDYFELEERYHRRHGEVEALREEGAAQRRDLQRLYDESAELRSVVEDQTAHLGRTYAEIERLQGVIRAMESTRAWRLHQRLGRWLGRRGS
jgi:LmbE family N-acetylglucosaminyl deacetylase/glycosyltransferase involved in cell wall biosynthesis